MTEQEQRVLVVAKARGWVRTPYHPRGAIKGIGVDCAVILIEVFAEAGLIERFDPGVYNSDWHLHRHEEVYLEAIERYSGAPVRQGDTIDQWGASDYAPGAGEILVWKIGNTFSHSAIVTDWPNVVHACAPSKIVEEVRVLGTPISNRPVRVYSIWA